METDKKAAEAAEDKSDSDFDVEKLVGKSHFKGDGKD